MRMAIQGAGTFTSVGMDVAQTMGSLLTRVQFFTEVDFIGNDGEGVVGAPAPVPEDRASGADRLLCMAALALRECAGVDPPEAAPLLLCVRDEAAGDSAIIDVASLAAEAGVPVDLSLSHPVAGGHAAIVRALRDARALFTSRKATACYIGGADSICDPGRLEVLCAANRVKSGRTSDGFIPGEGAAFLRVSSQPDEAWAFVDGLGVADRQMPIAGGQALTLAIRQALTEARAPAAEIGLLMHDVTGRRSSFQELALAVTRLRLHRDQEFQSWGPATSVGEVGAAMGPLSLAALAFYLREHVIKAPGALYVGSAEAGERAAVYLRRTDALHG